MFPQQLELQFLSFAQYVYLTSYTLIEHTVFLKFSLKICCSSFLQHCQSVISKNAHQKKNTIECTASCFTAHFSDVILSSLFQDTQLKNRIIAVWTTKTDATLNSFWTYFARAFPSITAGMGIYSNLSVSLLFLYCTPHTYSWHSQSLKWLPWD